jgi:tRNA(His) 5'-end guanylyltransferase
MSMPLWFLFFIFTLYRQIKRNFHLLLILFTGIPGSGKSTSFDCRLCVLPNLTPVTDYFVWRAEDAHRNSLNAYCYWKLQQTGKSVAEATNQLKNFESALAIT